MFALNLVDFDDVPLPAEFPPHTPLCDLITEANRCCGEFLQFVEPYLVRDASAELIGVKEVVWSRLNIGHDTENLRLNDLAARGTMDRLLARALSVGKLIAMKLGEEQFAAAPMIIRVGSDHFEPFGDTPVEAQTDLIMRFPDPLPPIQFAHTVGADLVDSPQTILVIISNGGGVTVRDTSRPGQPARPGRILSRHSQERPDVTETVPPNILRRGSSTAILEPKPWKLLTMMLKEGAALVEDVERHVWGEVSEREWALKSAMSKANNGLFKVHAGISISRSRDHLVLR